MCFFFFYEIDNTFKKHHLPKIHKIKLEQPEMLASLLIFCVDGTIAWPESFDRHSLAFMARMQ